MSVFAVTYTYSDDVATRDAVRPEHRAYLDGLAGDARVLVAGAYAPDEPAGALLLIRAVDRAAVEAAVAADPFTAAGVITSSSIVGWNPAVGPLAAAF